MHDAISFATPATLEAFYALRSNPDAEGRASYLRTVRARLESGQLRPEQLAQLKRDGEVVAAITLGSIVPLIPRLHEHISSEDAGVFLSFLRDWSVRQGVEDVSLVLLDSLAPELGSVPEDAGWQLDSEDVVYQTDLATVSHLPDSLARQLSTEDLGDPAFLEAFAPIFAVWPDRQGDLPAYLDELRENFGQTSRWELHALQDEAGAIVGVGSVYASRPGAAGITLHGVLPGRRGEGFGRRLHAHLLSVAATFAQTHAGGTGARNHAMRRVFEVNGGALASAQRTYRLADS